MHALDITNGQASFADSRNDAWHQLGTQLDGAFTAEEAMIHANLGGWDVRKTPLFTTVGGQDIEVPGKFAVVRNNPVTGRVNPLGVVGESYVPIQNEAHADYLNALVDESGAHFETAGAIDEGRRVFMSMKLPGHMQIGGVDTVENYIAAFNSHDGSMAFTFMVTPVRVVCKNTMNFAFGQHPVVFKVRHTPGVAKMQEVRRTLDLTFKALDDFQVEANHLVDTALTQTQFEEIIANAFSADEDAAQATKTRADNRIDEMLELFAEASTQDGIRDTAWAALNAITEWADHFAPTRGDDRDGSRARNAILNPTFKARALSLVRAAV